MSCSGLSDMEMTALMLNDTSFCSFIFMDASKGIQRHLNQTANAISLRTANFEIMILSIIKQMPSAVFSVILLSQTPIGSPLRYRACSLISLTTIISLTLWLRANLCCRVSPFLNQWLFLVRGEGAASQGWNVSMSS